ncbi:CDP-glucose 4,6-dehydratase [Desulfatibacillum alkenivorans DSM 16219]|jgi:CDP-glucose 4,6-dehydratase|uniref:CDP-glucose 4,6-dehydratase n=1 Tax=Desulfatibacillum alkenivorans DSM 16219 TaxID=1121393 RepID=A0A1M6RWQ4_9BACT|nr:CDP-glucose 4,6-dehydratase [Desulfatibacillum alkenivorans]SHK36870.1 CDP-glucose 4,6-dehydratase [Desulfatibacillum alkenivorans DSM 16219]
MTDRFYKNKRIFLTGHTGFKGAWLSLWLLEAGAEVMGYALAPPTQPSLFSLAGLEDRMQSVTGDIRDPDALTNSMKQFQPDVVIHMAAQSLVREGYSDPVGTFSTNVMGTVNLLEAVRSADSVRAVVNVTTDKCYENKEWHWGYRENDRLGGHDPYAGSKACAELVSQSYAKSYFDAPGAAALATVRAGNVIGGGDFAKDRLIPDAVRAAQAGAPVEVRSPGAVRPWQHVLEPLRGYLMLARNLYEQGAQCAGAWNFGPSLEDCQPVAWILDRFLDAMGHEPGWTGSEGDHPKESIFLRLDSSKAKLDLGWTPRLDISQSLRLTAEWYANFLAGDQSPLDYTIKQIREYVQGEL